MKLETTNFGPALLKQITPIQGTMACNQLSSMCFALDRFLKITFENVEYPMHTTFLYRIYMIHQKVQNSSSRVSQIYLNNTVPYPTTKYLI